jgi:hypothetical protein
MRSAIRATADAVIQELIGRKGFDGVWDSLDEATKEEVRAALEEIITNHGDGSTIAGIIVNHGSAGA